MRVRHRGSTLALSVSIVGVFVLALAFFAINYGQIFGTHKQAQSAIDAAALQAAADISLVRFNGLSGPVAIADQAPPGNDLNNRYVKSINKVLASARLSLLIANEIGNNHLADLAAMDIQTALEDASGLARAIHASLPTIRQRAQEVYDINSRRLGKGKRVGPLQLSLGRFVNATSAFTNIPVPSPQEMAQVDSTTSVVLGGKTYYRAQINVPVNAAGRTFNVVFFGTGKGAALVPNDEFLAVANDVAPCLVQVSAQEEINGMAPNFRQPQKSTLRAVATAQCGGHLANEPTGTFTMSFRGGLPDNGSNLNFDDIAHIMNSTGWNPNSTGKWFKAFNGPVPVPGRNGPDWHGRFVRARYRGSFTDTPNDALAAHIYDWLRTCGIRPNIKAVKQALTYNLRQSLPHPVTFPQARSTSMIPASQASQSDGLLPQAAALFDMSTDRRDQENFDKNPEKYSAQVANVFNYKPTAATIEETALACAIDDKGMPVTTDGNNVNVLPAFFTSLSQFSRICKDSFEAGRAVAQESFEALKEPVKKAATLRADKAFLEGQTADMRKNHPENTGAIAAFEERLKEIDSQIAAVEATIAEGVRKFNRAEFVMLNADYGMHTVAAVLKNMKGLTAGGVAQFSGNHFRVHGANYLPATICATRKQIEGDGPISTGQFPIARLRDWAAPAKGGTCQLEFLDRAVTPVAHTGMQQPSIMQPALAATSVPLSGDFIFTLNVEGSAAMPDAFGQGQVTIYKINSSPFGPSILEGQYLYQNVRAIAQQRPGKPVLYWQAMGRNHAGNTNGTYFANTKAKGFNVSPKTWCSVIYGDPVNENQPLIKCPALAAEFVFTCPMPEGQCVPQSFHVGGAWSGPGADGFGGGDIRYTMNQAERLLDLANQVIANPTPARIQAFWLALRGRVLSTDAHTTQLFAYIVHFSLSQTGEYSFRWYTPGQGWQTFQGYGIDIRMVVPCATITIEHG